MTPEALSRIEQGLLGKVLADPKAWQQVAGRVSVEDFASEAHAAIFAAIAARALKGLALEPVGVFAEIAAPETLGIELQHIEALAGAFSTAAGVDSFVADLRAASGRRAIRAAACTLLRELDGGADPVESVEAFRSRTAGPVSASQRTGRFAPVVFSDLADTEPPPQRVWWGPWLPAGVVTLLAAHGGTGKSTVALMLAAAVAAGSDLFGVPTRRGRVAYYSAEDSAPVVRRRLARVLRAMAIAPSDLEGWLHVLDATADDPVLYRESTAGGLRGGYATDAYSELRGFVVQHEIDVVIVDNASDAFDASEIDRARVRAFMRSLTDLIKDREGAVLLLAHVDKGTSRGDRGANSEGYSGSTAWHNSARSRVFMRRETDGALLLKHEKANLTRLADPIRLDWPADGMPRPEYVPSGFVAEALERSEIKSLIRLIAEFRSLEKHVSTAPTSRAHAGKMLRGHAGFPPKLRDADLFDRLRDAERLGWLARETYRGHDRKARECWSVTAEGAAFAGLPPSAATAATAATSVVGAHGAEAAEPCGDCGDLPPGGVGGRARTEVAAQWGGRSAAGAGRAA